MKIIGTKDYEHMSQAAAEIIIEKIKEKPDMVLGLATGASPLQTYRCLAQRYQEGSLSLKQVSAFNLDEYAGLPKTHEQSFYHYIKENLISQTDLQEENVHVLHGMAEDAELECKAYEERIAQLGGIDIQLLGIGLDGHIGFNEPDHIFSMTAHVSNLEEETRQANAKYFSRLEEVPKKAMTMGIGTIMQAEALLLLVSGREKAVVLAQALYGPINPQLPASIVQIHHNCTVVVDEPALQELKKAKDTCFRRYQYETF